METTIHLDDRLFAEAKSYAEQSARSLSQVVEEALREKLKTTLVSRTHALGTAVETTPGIHPDVQRITGLAPAEVDAEGAHLAHLAERHK